MYAYPEHLFRKVVQTTALLLCVGVHQLPAQTTFPKTGYASFYADKFNGRRTASGEIYSQKKLTCAHRSLPFGTLLKVTNQDNGKSVIVTVNDRGPFLRRRIVDVSKAAARQLDFIALGETRVSIELVSLDDTDSICATADTAQAFYRVQEIDRGFTGFSVRLGTYLMQDVAFDIAHNLKQQTNVEVFVQSAVKQSGYIYRVYAGRFAGKNDAEQWKEKIKEFYPNASVVQFMP